MEYPGLRGLETVEIGGYGLSRNGFKDLANLLKERPQTQFIFTDFYFPPDFTSQHINLLAPNDYGSDLSSMPDWFLTRLTL